MTLLYYDDEFLRHDTGGHPECAERLVRTRDHLEANGLIDRCRHRQPLPADRTDIERVHSPEHIERVKQFAEQGGGRIEADTFVSVGSYDAAVMAVGAACDAVRRVVHGEDQTALALVRPPGHHALANAPMGFCLFNNVAVAAKTATDELGLDRVLIVDWDVHHGNGTQDAFWHDEHVGFLSIHRFPFYPGTGDGDETGSGSGLGSTLNVPIAFGTSRAEYLRRFEESVRRFADHIKPDLVLISAGFDSHCRDPIGSLGLETEDFGQLTRCVIDVAQGHCEGRIVSLLEGGYNTQILPHCIQTHLEQLLQSGEPRPT